MLFGVHLDKDVPFKRQLIISAVHGTFWGFGMAFAVTFLVLFAAHMGWIKP